jgi:hypothetical protein
MNNFKLADAQQAKIIYSHKRTKEKLYKTSVAV